MLPYVADTHSWANRWIGDGIIQPLTLNGMPLFPSWVPAEDQRRLSTYTVCAAFADGCSHYWQPYLDSEDQRRKWREYGDPELFTTQARSAVLGETQTISVTVPETEDGAQPDPLAEAARSWLVDWATTQALTTRLLDAEHDALGLGDCVYALGLDAGGPRLRVYDPGFYFPDPQSQGIDDDYPRTVHLAWEEPHPKDPKKMLLRRRTWKLMALASLPGAETTRTYPWSDTPSPDTCLYWDGVWDLNAVAGPSGFYDLADRNATWTVLPDGTEAAGFDLNIDFIPVVHVPNGSPGKVTWGRPVWWSIIRLLDDIAASDTDAQVGSELYGSGALLDKGGGIPDSTGPGVKWAVPESADAKFVDMSAGMKAMVAFRQSQRELASQNARLPAEALGRVDPSTVLSGVAIRMRWGPLANLVRELRQVRGDKMSLLLKFTLRLAQRAGLLPPGVLPVAALIYGPFMPSDMAEAVSSVTQLWDRPNQIISLETAIRILVAAGFPIDDAHEELKRINRQAYTRQLALLDASGDESLVRDLLRDGELGVIPDAPAVLPVPAPVPPVPVPPTGGA